MLDWLPKLEPDGGDRYRVLADTLAAAIRAGRWPAGARLPTQRELSRRLAVSVSTVSRAYAELARAGLIESTVGRGSFVAHARHQPAERDPDDTAWLRYQSMYLPLAGRREIIDLSLNNPLEHPDNELLAGGLRALTEESDLALLARYQAPEGRLEHREAAVRWLGFQGVAAEARDVLIAPGGQGGLATILLALCGAGGTVLAEELTWPGMLALTSVLGLKLQPVAMDAYGLRPDALEAACRTWRPSALYTMPTLHNPTGITTPAERRREIARIARAHNVMIVEDDAYGFLLDAAPPNYVEIARADTIYITSLSKSIAPTMRVAFLVAPRGLAPRLAAVLRATTMMVSPLIAELAAQLIGSGAAFDAARFQAAAARRRLALAAEALAVTPPNPASFHLWMPLPSGWGTVDFVTEGLAHGVAVTPGTAFCAHDSRDPRGVRVCLCSEADEARLTSGLQTLARLLDSEQLMRMPVI